MKKTLTVVAQKEQLDDVTSFIIEELEKYACPMKILMQMELVIEEIFVNICHYSGSEMAEIVMDICEDTRSLTLVFKDRGVPFDPLKKEDADITLSAEERQIGGLGIFLVKKLMNEVRYDYEEGQNILTIVKLF